MHHPPRLLVLKRQKIQYIFKFFITDNFLIKKVGRDILKHDFKYQTEQSNDEKMF